MRGSRATSAGKRVGTSRGRSPRPRGRVPRSFADRQVHGGIGEEVNLAEKVKTSRGLEQQNLTGQEQWRLWTKQERRAKYAERGAARNGDGGTLRNGVTPAGGPPRALRRESGNRTHPKAFRHQGKCCVRGLPCDYPSRVRRERGRYVLHARCVVEGLARGASLAPAHCPAIEYGYRHTGRVALEAAVQADSDLCSLMEQPVDALEKHGA